MFCVKIIWFNVIRNYTFGLKKTPIFQHALMNYYLLLQILKMQYKNKRVKEYFMLNITLCLIRLFSEVAFLTYES